MALATYPNLIYVDDVLHTNSKGDAKTYITVIKVDKKNEGEGAVLWYQLRTKNPHGMGLIPYLRNKPEDTRIEFSDDVTTGYIFYDVKFYDTADDVPA